MKVHRLGGEGNGRSQKRRKRESDCEPYSNGSVGNVNGKAQLKNKGGGTVNVPHEAGSMINKDKAIMTRYDPHHIKSGQKHSKQTNRRKKWLKALEERMRKAGL